MSIMRTALASAMFLILKFIMKSKILKKTALLVTILDANIANKTSCRPHHIYTNTHSKCLYRKTLFFTILRKGKVTPIPKIGIPTTPYNYRSIIILPTLSKIYEKLLGKQIVDYVERMIIHKNTNARFSTNSLPTTLLLKFKDDIIKVMGRGEVTLVVIADFLKIFNTTDRCTVIKKLKKLGFSKKYLLLL